MSVVNETLIRDIVSEVLGRLGGAAVGSPGAAPASAPCGCAKTTPSGGNRPRGHYGVFADANEACQAAHEAYLQLQEKGIAARARIVDLVKAMCEAKAAEWGRLELDETKIGRLDHKIEKL